MYAHQTKYDEWSAFTIKDYQKEHPGASNAEASKAKKNVLASGTAQIWECGYWGEDNRVIFEIPNARLEIIAASGDFVLAQVSRFNPDTGENLDGFQTNPVVLI